ncbi:8-oxo-dGTP diphosphatase [Paramicrobacterium humi]|uniref:Oxidized purine nucleoside triphosphate hydrolase n=1 Tax=Paramicrobacterium humi TaxID=640635 RepID=A0A1H4PLD4_9MICO|nr:8-oxo-dGTP diphosphatase [Microbacterium humi]SEC08195.1 8-oxo-dGTP diphosphatase [Microbacterium humi]
MPHPDVCVCYLLRETPDGVHVLLGRKKRGLGTGNIVGLGGKLEPGEDAATAAVREIREESGLAVAREALQPRGRLDYRFPFREEWSQVSHVFVCTRWQGEPRGSDELDPVWYPLHGVPYGQMWDDARYWLPDVLAGGTVDARFDFAEDLATVARSTGVEAAS